MNNVITTEETTALMQIFYYLSKVIGAYSFILVIRIMLSWFPRPVMYNQYGQPVEEKRPVFDFLCKITDPFLKVFKSSKLTIGRIDFSTLFAFFVLNILQSLCLAIASYGKITLGMILAVCLQGVWSYLISYFLVILLILLGIRCYLGARPGKNTSVIDRIIQAPVNLIFRIFYKHKYVSEQKLIITSLITYFVVFIILRYVFKQLVPLLFTI